MLRKRNMQAVIRTHCCRQSAVFHTQLLVFFSRILDHRILLLWVDFGMLVARERPILSCDDFHCFYTILSQSINCTDRQTDVMLMA